MNVVILNIKFKNLSVVGDSYINIASNSAKERIPLWQPYGCESRS